MMASYPPLAASFWQTSGISKAPGARTISNFSAPTPWRRKKSSAPPSKCARSKLLLQATTMAKRASVALKSASMVFMLMLNILSALPLISRSRTSYRIPPDEFNGLEVEAGNGVIADLRAHQRDLADADVTQT